MNPINFVDMSDQNNLLRLKMQVYQGRDKNFYARVRQSGKLTYEDLIPLLAFDPGDANRKGEKLFKSFCAVAQETQARTEEEIRVTTESWAKAKEFSNPENSHIN